MLTREKGDKKQAEGKNGKCRERHERDWDNVFIHVIHAANSSLEIANVVVGVKLNAETRWQSTSIYERGPTEPTRSSRLVASCLGRPEGDHARTPLKFHQIISFCPSPPVPIRAGLLGSSSDFSLPPPFARTAADSPRCRMSASTRGRINFQLINVCPRRSLDPQREGRERPPRAVTQMLRHRGRI